MKAYPHCMWQMGPCYWCGVETHRRSTACSGYHPNMYTRDHLIPQRLRRATLLGDRHSHLVTVTSCASCNFKKGKTSALVFAKIMGLPPEKQRYIARVYSMNHR